MRYKNKVFNIDKIAKINDAYIKLFVNKPVKGIKIFINVSKNSIL